MTTQFQQTAEMQPQHVSQSQQTQTISLVAPRKKEKILLPCMHCKDSFRTECQLQVRISFLPLITCFAFLEFNQFFLNKIVVEELLSLNVV